MQKQGRTEEFSPQLSPLDIHVLDMSDSLCRKSTCELSVVRHHVMSHSK